MTHIKHHSIDKVIVKVDCTIKDALKIISENRLLSVFVVDKNNYLLGSLTDGDIRYGILKGLNLDISVRSIMNSNPIVVKDKKSSDEIYKLMLDKSIMIIPRVDKKGKLIDYYHFIEVSNKIINHKKSLTGKKDPKTSSINKNDVNTVMVIGGAGYIGSVLVRKLLLVGYKVKVLDALLYGEDSVKDLFTNSNFKLIRGDVRNTETLLSSLKNVDAVIHLGEIVGDPACALNDDFTLDVNFMATNNIIEICVLYGIHRMIFASSCSVYGIGDGSLSEQSDLNPVSLYAQCKIECEKVIMSYNGKNFCPTILRLATVFGSSYRPRFDLVVNLLTAKAILEGQITIFGGKQWRPFINVNDVVRAFIISLKAPLELVGGEVFNTGDERLNYQIIEVGNEIKKVYPNLEVIIEKNNDDPRDYNVNFSKINEILDFNCKTNLNKGILELVQMIKDRRITDYNYKYFHNLLTLKG